MSGKLSVKKVGVVGLGKLGSALMAALLHRGYEVVGVDSEQAVVDALAPPKPHPVTYEPDVIEILHAHAGNYHVGTDYERLADAAVIFVTVPTPSDADGRYDVTCAVDSFSRIAVVLNSAPFMDRLVVLQSTVMPGDMDGSIVPAFDIAAYPDVMASVGICYNPEFIALGSVVQDILHPNTILIGESDVLAGQSLVEFYSEFLPDAPVPNVMSFGSAELSKLCLNTMITAKITMANLIGLLCERIHGGDAMDVTRAIGGDPRIGSLYLQPGLPYGGPCFPRDNRALTKLMRDVDVLSCIPEEVDSLNRHMMSLYAHASLLNVMEVAETYLGTSYSWGSVGSSESSLCMSIVGVAYKDHTPVIEESAALSLAMSAFREISGCGGDVGKQLCICDPLVSCASLLRHLVDGFRREDDIKDAILYGDVVLLTGRGLCKEFFYALDDAAVVDLLRGKVVVDYWRVLPEWCWDSKDFVCIVPMVNRPPRYEE